MKQIIFYQSKDSPGAYWLKLSRQIKSQSGAYFLIGNMLFGLYGPLDWTCQRLRVGVFNEFKTSS